MQQTDLRLASSEDDHELVYGLTSEYAASLGVDLSPNWRKCFQLASLHVMGAVFSTAVTRIYEKNR